MMRNNRSNYMMVRSYFRFTKVRFAGRIQRILHAG